MHSAVGRVSRLVIAIAMAGGACVSKHPDPVVLTSIVIAPRNVIIRAAQTVDFTVTTVNVSNPAEFACILSSTAIGSVTKTTSGCRLVVGTPAIPGTLYARIGLLADSAALVVTGAAR